MQGAFSVMKKFIFYLITYLFLFIFIFTGFEIARRIKGDRRENTHLFDITQKKAEYLFKPNSVIRCVTPERELEYTAGINAQGYRGRDFSVPKPEGNLRIFVIGDSFTFGVGARDDETIPYLLEQALKKKYPNIDVINAGIGHTSPITHFINIKNIHLKYEPDVVVLLFDMTDLWDDWHSERSAVRNTDGQIEKFDITYIYGKRSWWRTCLRTSAACRFFNNKIVRTFKKIQIIGIKKYVVAWLRGIKAKALIANQTSRESYDAQTEYDGLLLMRGREKKELIDYHWKRTAGYLNEIRDLLAQNGIGFVLGVYPHGIYVGPDQWSEGRLAWGFAAGCRYTDLYPFELLTQYARDNDVPFINMLDDFLDAPPDKYFFDWDGHLTPAGNRLVVKSLVDSGILNRALDKHRLAAELSSRANEN